MRAAVTGLGVITPYGTDVDALRGGFEKLECALGPLEAGPLERRHDHVRPRHQDDLLESSGRPGEVHCGRFQAGRSGVRRVDARGGRGRGGRLRGPARELTQETLRAATARLTLGLILILLSLL